MRTVFFILLFVASWFGINWFWAWATGWVRAARRFGPPPARTTTWARYATCVTDGGVFRLPVAVCVSELGLVLVPHWPFRLLLRPLWAPWQELVLTGPHWFTRRELSVAGFPVVLCASVAARIGEALNAGGVSLDE